MSDEPVIAVSIEQKVGLPNYGSASAFISVSNLPAGATIEDIDALLDTGKLAYDRMRERLQERVREIRAEGGYA